MTEKKQLSPAEAAGALRNIILILSQKTLTELIGRLNALSDNFFDDDAAGTKLHIELTYAAVAGTTKAIQTKIGAPEAAAVWQAHQDQVKAKDIINGYQKYYDSASAQAAAALMVKTIGITDETHKTQVSGQLAKVIAWLSSHPVELVIKSAEIRRMPTSTD